MSKKRGGGWRRTEKRKEGRRELRKGEGEGDNREENMGRRRKEKPKGGNERYMKEEGDLKRKQQRERIRTEKRKEEEARKGTLEEKEKREGSVKRLDTASSCPGLGRRGLSAVTVLMFLHRFTRASPSPQTHSPVDLSLQHYLRDSVGRARFFTGCKSLFSLLKYRVFSMFKCF